MPAAHAPELWCGSQFRRHVRASAARPSGKWIWPTHTHNWLSVKEFFTSPSATYTQDDVAGWPLRWGDRKFGWVHIEGKHGWSEADRAATATALLNTPLRIPPQEDADAERWIYSGPSYGGGEVTTDGKRYKVTCFRFVVVHPRPYSNAAPGTPARGIITSYGGWRSEALVTP